MQNLYFWLSLGALVLGGLLVHQLLGRGLGWLEERVELRRARRGADETHLRQHQSVGPGWQSLRGPHAPVAARDWVLAAGAHYAFVRGARWDQLAFSDPDHERAVLSESWGVQNRRGLLTSLHWVWVEGHRVGMRREIEHWSSLSVPAAAAVESELRGMASLSDDSEEQLWRFRRVLLDDRDVRSLNGLAWDLVRFIMLTRSGVSAGYLTEEEGTDFLDMVAPELQEEFTSWQDLAAQFSLGRWFWNSTSGRAEAEADGLAVLAQRDLSAPPDGPWSIVPWEVRLPATRHLFVDRLLDERVVSQREVRESGSATAQGRRLAALMREHGHHGMT